MHILDLVELDNIAEKLDSRLLDEIGQRVVEEYDVDKGTMNEWEARNEISRKLISTKPEKRNDPWPGAANTKLPLILNAAMKVSAEEFAEVMRGRDLVQYETFGKVTPEKEARAKRVAARMNFQYHREMEDWEEDHDRLILAKNLLGVVHKKYFFSPEKNRSECALRLSGVVVNDNVTNLSEAPRITDEIEKFWWQAEEKFRSGEWIKIDLDAEQMERFAKNDKPNEFLEQIRREDLDEDGYPEPYIVTVHKKTRKVVRIAPNYTPESITWDKPVDANFLYDLSDEEIDIAKENLGVVRVDDSRARVRYVKYEMIPDFDGSYWGWGFGILLGALTENSNELVNQLLNAGTLANNRPIFMSQNLRMGHGEKTVGPGELIPVNAPGGDIARSILPMPVNDPSQTLFSLLGLLMDVLRELSSVTEVVAGEQPEANMPASSVAMLIEQGKKAFGSIYKRHYRALTKEFTALYDLNFLYEDPGQYLKFHDLEEVVAPNEARALVQGDFEREGLDVFPTASPEFSTRMQRIGEAQALKGALAESPYANQAYLDRMLVNAIIDDPERASMIVADEPNMTPQMVMQQMEVKMQEFLDSAKAREAEAKAKKAEVDLAMAMGEAELQGYKIPMEIERQEFLGDTAEHKAVAAAAQADKAIADAEKAQKEGEQVGEDA